MKFFLAFIILIFNFQSLTKADDIRDWNKKSGINDNLKVALFSAEYSEYLKQQNK